MPRNYKQFTLDDREHISVGIIRENKLWKIAQSLGRHVSAITREIKKHRVFVRGSYYAGNDCKYAQGCDKRHVCGDEDCPMYCYTCPKDCHNFCQDYSTAKCRKYERPPYVCNACGKRRYCMDDRYFYDSKVANKEARDALVNKRKHVHVSKEDLDRMDTLLTTNIKKGQPIAHIFATHEDELPVSIRSAYRYIDYGLLHVRNADLRRQAGYKKRRKKSDDDSGILNQKYRQGRTYDDFNEYMNGKSDTRVFEMDTVHGKRGTKKTMLTMLFRKNHVMLILLMPDCTAASVIYWFNFLESVLGTDVFHELFEICLTDNGSEFKRVDELELSSDNTTRTSVYYCDPMQSGQKGRLEKNHEYIRYVIPNGKSLGQFTQDDMCILMNHINSTKRPGLNNMSPYDLVADDDCNMHLLMKVLGMQRIPADDINLTPGLLSKK